MTCPLILRLRPCSQNRTKTSCPPRRHSPPYSRSLDRISPWRRLTRKCSNPNSSRTKRKGLLHLLLTAVVNQAYLKHLPRLSQPNQSLQVAPLYRPTSVDRKKDHDQAQCNYQDRHLYLTTSLAGVSGTTGRRSYQVASPCPVLFR